MLPKLATFGIWELLVILLIVVVIFGAGKLPQIGENLGKAIRSFRKSFKDEAPQASTDAHRLEDGGRVAQLPPADRAALGPGEKARQDAESPARTGQERK